MSFLPALDIIVLSILTTCVFISVSTIIEIIKKKNISYFKILFTVIFSTLGSSCIYLIIYVFSQMSRYIK